MILSCFCNQSSWHFQPLFGSSEVPLERLQCLLSKDAYFMAPIFIFGKFDALKAGVKFNFKHKNLILVFYQILKFLKEFSAIKYSKLKFTMRHFRQLLIWVKPRLFSYNSIEFKLG